MEKTTKERFEEGIQVMGKNREGVCVCTPSSSWRLVDSSGKGMFDKQLLGRNVSARKLGAHLWEAFPVCKMGVNYRDEISSQVPRHMPDSTHQAEGTTGQMSEAAQASVQLLPARLRNHCHRRKYFGTDISSTEAASYSLSDSDSTPSTSIQARESTFRLGSSVEMIKMLNRMLNLENQQISKSSDMEASTVELNDARTRIKYLHRYHHNEQQKADGMVEKILERKFGRNCKSQSKWIGTIPVLKSELDDERRRSKHLESLNGKLAQGIAEIKLSISSNRKELEKERRSFKIVEDLCDEFAKQILHRQLGVTSAKQRRSKEEKLIVRIAEAWLDERSQLNQHPDRFISSKLSSEMETFIKAKFSVGLKTNGDLSSSQGGRSIYRRSSESFLLNEPANQIPAHEYNSTENELSCFEKHRTTSRRSTKSSIGPSKCSAINLNPMVKDLSRKYSASANEYKLQTINVRALSTDSPSPTQHLRSKLTTSLVNQTQHSLARRSKKGSLGSHLLEASKRQHYCTPASRGSRTQNLCK